MRKRQKEFGTHRNNFITSKQSFFKLVYPYVTSDLYTIVYGGNKTCK